VLPSKAHQAFLERALPQLLSSRPRVPFDFPYTLHLTFHLKGKLDSDVDNLRTYAVEHESVTISAGNHVQLRKS